MDRKDKLTEPTTEKAENDCLTNNIIKYIREILDKKGLKQKDLARLMGKKESEVSKWMKGNHNFTLDTISIIEKALGESIVSIPGDEPAEPSPHNDVIFIKSQFDQSLSLTYAPGVRAGFPSPAEQYEVEALDFNRDMIAHPDTTFYARVMGDSMIGAGINEGDIVVVDRSLEPKNHDIVVAFYDHQYTLKFYDESHKAEGYISLVPANKRYPVLKITPEVDCMIWGVVKYTIKKWA